MPNTDDDKHLEEWKAARDVLNGFDERLHDLRKYGFTFVTALLAAESILIPGPAAVAAGTAAIPDTIKLAVIIATLLLIVGVRVIDKFYRLFQQAAAIRAKIIERAINFELTEVIADRLGAQRFWRYVNLLYYLFAITTGMLGAFILFPNLPAVAAAIIATGVILVAIMQIERGFQLRRKRYERYPFNDDWTIDRLEIKRGGNAKITLTNLGEESITFMAGAVVWGIVAEQNQEVVYQRKARTAVSILKNDNYSWLWSTEGVKTGIYGVVPFIPFKWPAPLRRKISVT